MVYSNADSRSRRIVLPSEKPATGARPKSQRKPAKPKASLRVAVCLVLWLGLASRASASQSSGRTSHEAGGLTRVTLAVLMAGSGAAAAGLLRGVLRKEV